MSLYEELCAIQAAVFKRDKNTWSRIHTEEQWEIYQGPIEIWFQNVKVSDEETVRLINILNKTPKLQTLRFHGTNISEEKVCSIHKMFPNISLEVT